MDVECQIIELTATGIVPSLSAMVQIATGDRMTHTNMDDAKVKFDALCSVWASKRPNIDNEANTRFQLIDTILTEILGWDKLGDFNLEAYGESGFADYILRADSRDRMVVEAKRSGSMLIDTHVSKVQYLTAKSSGLKTAQPGLLQSQGYCIDNGVHFAVLTNGLEWIAYWAIRKGTKPAEGKVIVFPSLDSISNEFSVFWDLFSRDAVIEERYQVVIKESEGITIQSAEILKPILRDGDYKLLTKSKLAHDLDGLFKQFFSSMSGDADREMVEKCFVESKESREADVSLEKISSTLINRLESMSSESGIELVERLENAVDSQNGEFVLIIGNKGAGKSTFIIRFFRQILSKNLLERCVVLSVDVGKSTGHKDSIVPWLDKQLLDALEVTLFSNGRATYEQLQGIFYSEYQRWRDGPHKILYESNKVAFKEKFGDHLEQMRRDDPHTYIVSLLSDVISNRKKMPCLVFDNTDHFDEPFQEKVFQYAQSIFRRIFCFIICPITDRTIWQLSKHGPFQSYETTSFFLPVPAMKEVLAKRVNFIKDKAGDDDDIERKEYFLSKGIRLNIKDIKAFAACIEEVFIGNEGQSRIIGGLANFDIRRSLQLSQQIMTSPHIKVDELIKFYLSDGSIQINQRQINYALLCGDSNHFSTNSSSLVSGIYQVHGDKITSPLIRLSILRLMLDIDQRGDPDSSHISLEKIFEYFDSMGFSRSAIKAHTQELSDAGLAAPYSPIEAILNESSRIRITPSGKIHLEWGVFNMNYIIENSISTPLRIGANKDHIQTLWSAKGRMTGELWRELAAAFISYCLEEDAVFCSIPSMSSYDSQRELRDTLRNRWINASSSSAPQ